MNASIKNTVELNNFWDHWRTQRSSGESSTPNVYGAYSNIFWNWVYVKNTFTDLPFPIKSYFGERMLKIVH